MERRRWLTCLAIHLPLILSCGRGHDLGVASGGGGAGGSTGIPSGFGGTSTPTSSSSIPSSGSTSTTVDAGTTAEPAGPTRLSVVNGIIDREAVKFCFLPASTPWPDSPLPFAASAVIDPGAGLPAGVDVVPWVVSGESLGTSCADLVSRGGSDASPSVVARPLGVIPSSVLAANRSLLLVATGCLSTGESTDVCGGDSTNGPAPPTAVLGAMSRLLGGNVGIQVAHASPGARPFGFRVQSSAVGATPLTVVSSLSYGAIGPFPPYESISTSYLGDLLQARIVVSETGTTSRTVNFAFGDVLAKSSLPPGGLHDGKNFVFIAVGAPPQVNVGPLAHAFTLVALSASPD